MLRETAPEAIATALTDGVMKIQAAGMSPDEIHAVAAYLSSKPFGESPQALARPNPCKKPAGKLRINAQHWNGWGRDAQNTRYQPNPGFSARDVPRLKLKWAYAYAGRFAQGQPTLIGERVFVSSSRGEVKSLDARTGCELWTFYAAASVKTAAVAGTAKAKQENISALFFGDERAAVYAVNADTGELLWRTVVDTHPVARVVGGSAIHSGILYVPVSAAEEAAARDPKYQCCTFRGSVVALDMSKGSVVWKAHAIPNEPKPTKLSTAGTQRFGPAGAAIWSTPTIDPDRGLLYVGTGNSYTDVVTDGTNAIIAFDLRTGQRRWVYQATERDNFVIGCPAEQAGQNNCPEQGGPDVDFGASPVLQAMSKGRQILLAGQKSGVVHGIDPDNGKLLWKEQVGSGSPLGGIEWGLASDASSVYAAVSDAPRKDNARPGLTALNIADGKRRWHVPTPPAVCFWGTDRCRRGQPGAVTAMPGVVFSGALDGHVRAYDSNDGHIIWDFDTAKPVATINGPVTAGGSIDAAGPTLANGMLYINSGYGRWGYSGRLLLVFSVDGK